MTELLGNGRVALRRLLKARSFSIVAVLSLAVGIGANSTIFGVANALLLRPLPYKQSDRLVSIFNTVRHRRGEGVGATVSLADIVRWRHSLPIFDGIEGISWGATANAFVSGGRAERITMQYFTPGLFALLGVEPVLGHVPSEQDEELTRDLTPTTISYEYWQRHFAARSDVVGRTAFLDNREVTIAAVLPPGFALFGGRPPDVVVLMTTQESAAPDWTDRWLGTVALLKAGVSMKEAQAALDNLSPRLKNLYPQTNTNIELQVKPLRETLFGWSRELLLPLAAAVAFVLLIACANIANLLLSRGLARQQEFKIRVALGASRWQIMGQVLLESVLLSSMGGLLGLLLAIWGIRIVVGLAPDWLPHADSIVMDNRVLLFTAAVAVLTGLLFGILPALRLSGMNGSTVFVKRTESSFHTGAGGERTRNALVIAEMALAMLLLTGAGLMVSTMVHVLHAKPGFEPEHLVTLEVRLTGNKYFDGGDWARTGLDSVTPAVNAYCGNILSRLEKLGGVRSVALVDWLPMVKDAERGETNYVVSGGSNEGSDRPHAALVTGASAGYLDTMQIPLLRGRQLAQKDGEHAPPVALINETLAKERWGNRNPIGQRITLLTDALQTEENSREIIGIVADVRQFRLSVDPRPEIYIPYAQQARHFTSGATESRLHKSIVVRIAGNDTSVLAQAKRTAMEVDPNSPVFGVQTVDHVLYDSSDNERFYTELLSTFAAVALVLAAMGIYGVSSYNVTERRSELGLRIALGAKRTDILRLIFTESLQQSMVGAGIGVGLSFFGTHLLSNLLYGVGPNDGLTMACAFTFLVLVALGSAGLPALEATQLDPMSTLRHD